MDTQTDEGSGTAGPVDCIVRRPYPKRADWRHDPHAYECYTCDQKGAAPRGNAQCTGCINRSTRPHWRPHPDYAATAQRVILVASGKAPNGHS